MQPAYNEMFLFRIGDFATKRQQLVSLRVLFLCRLGKDMERKENYKATSHMKTY